jgi:hypothetical protein
MRRTAALLFAVTTLLALFALGGGSAEATTLTRYQQNAGQLAYSGTWTVGSAAAASNGSYRYAKTAGSSVTVTFKGTYLAWIAKKNPTYGIARVSVDGGASVSVDLFSKTAVYQRKVWETGTLRAGTHTVRIQWTGTRNSSASGTTICVDAFDVAGTLVGVTRVEQTDQHLSWRGDWARVSSSSYSGGTAWYANSAGASVTIEFDGASLTLLGKKGPTYGIAAVSLDGGTPVRVDLYNSTTIYRQKFWSTGFLVPGRHVVKLEWTGMKRAAATRTNVALDALEVRGTLRAAPLSYLAFDSARAMAHLDVLAGDIGVRHGGSPQEWEAVQYAVSRLTALGYQPQLTDVPVIDGSTSHNVTVVKPGSSDLTLVIGAHIDSYGVSPGGNDNASGSAAILELARDIKNADLAPTIVLMLFGHEEPVGDGNADHHHYGSRRFVADMTAEQRARLVGMISLDMVGYGTTFNARFMEKGPRTLVNMLLSHSSLLGNGLVYLKDPSTYGYSDHEPFELAGYPAAWLEWRVDGANHTSGDTASHCSPAKIQRAGGLVLSFLASLRVEDLRTLQAARR